MNVSELLNGSGHQSGPSNPLHGLLSMVSTQLWHWARHWFQKSVKVGKYHQRLRFPWKRSVKAAQLGSCCRYNHACVLGHHDAKITCLMSTISAFIAALFQEFRSHIISKLKGKAIFPERVARKEFATVSAVWLRIDLAITKLLSSQMRVRIHWLPSEEVIAQPYPRSNSLSLTLELTSAASFQSRVKLVFRLASRTTSHVLADEFCKIPKVEAVRHNLQRFGVTNRARAPLWSRAHNSTSNNIDFGLTRTFLG